jgi:isopentenyl-diphosphate delta-isomerase
MIPAWIDGTLTPVEKLDAHRRGLRHKAVSVFVMCNGEVLIQQRAMGKYHTPGLWANTCCTHPEWDELPIDCAVRRLDQELGLSGITPDYRDRVEYRADVGDGLIEHELVDVFVAHVDTKPDFTPNSDEVMATAWMNYDALLEDIRNEPSRYTPGLRIYLDEFAERIFQHDLEDITKETAE